VEPGAQPVEEAVTREEEDGPTTTRVRVVPS
jgi:hypothetical protein